MDDRLAVGVAQGVCHFPRNLERIGQRELPLAAEPLAQTLALHIRHHIVEQSLCLAGVEEREDVWVLEAGGDSDFSKEAIGAEARHELGSQDLECDPPVVLEVATQIDGGHPPAAELTLNRVAPGEGGPEAGELVRQRGSRAATFAAPRPGVSARRGPRRRRAGAQGPRCATRRRRIRSPRSPARGSRGAR